jgi:hypothetical protein
VSIPRGAAASVSLLITSVIAAPYDPGAGAGPASGLSSTIGTSSIVRTGPVYFFFASTIHQIPTAIPTSRTSGE